MKKHYYFEKFVNERNIKESTINGYISALKKYGEFNNESIDFLIDEAINEEEKLIPLKKRKIKERLISFRQYLLKSDLSSNSVKTYFFKVKTFYKHFEIQIPLLPDVEYEKVYEINYFDLPTKNHIKEVLDVVSIDLKAVILFMSSSGTASAETLSLSVNHFINATGQYHNGGTLKNILNTLLNQKNIVPTFYLKRLKTDKYYYTFCSPEATTAIVKYLKTRKNLTLNDNLFDFSTASLISKFQEINDKMGWGFKGKFRFFRSHALRKYHASNISLSSEYIDALQGRGKTSIHETYIKTNPEKLKEIYMSAMENVMIYGGGQEKVEKQEFNITINVFLSGKEYNIF